MKIISSSRSFSFLKKTIKNDLISSYILGIENYSLFSEYEYNLNEIKEVIKYLKKHNKKVIIDIARLFHEEEMDSLINLIKKLNSYDVDYFMYSDFGVHYILEELGLLKKTMLYSNTYLTNVLDTKIYQEKNGMVVLSNQINSEELINIVKKSYDNKVVLAFGNALIMYTKRPLLTNYFKYRGVNKEGHKKTYSLQEEYRDDLYPIIENKNSTKIYDYGHFYLLDELKELGNTDIIISGELLNNKEYMEVLNLYSSYINKNIESNDVILEFEKNNIKLHKGAYNKKLTLLKGVKEETNNER